MIGKTISRYRVVQKLGQGGMGEVYLAEDASLDRHVALKFLAPELQDDEVALKRFLREAKAAAAVDHPYVCKVLEVGEEEGRAFIVLEHVEGPTLRHQIENGPFTIEDAVRTATEIAEALEEAHRRGIVHRDLKPSNVMITAGGHVKVMDFGLARQIVQPGDSTSQEQTLSALTKAGSTPGTLAYMSPEQLRSEPADARSDLFALGIVLYEMLAGVHPFRRNEAMETASAILKDDPPSLERHRADVPPLLEHVVRKLLARDADDRYQSAHDLVTDLRASTQPRAETSLSRFSRWWPALGSLAIAIVVLLAFALRPQQTAITTSASLQIVPLTSYPGAERQPTFNPDGSQVAFTWDGPEQDNQDIYVKVVGAAEPLRLTTDPAWDGSPAWSRDGRQIAFLRDAGRGISEIRLIRPTGGPERVLSTLRTDPTWGLSWSSDGRILVGAHGDAPGKPTAIVALDVETLQKERLTDPPALGRGDRYPEYSPDDRRIAFKRDRAVLLLDRESGEIRRVADRSYGTGLGWTSEGSGIVLATSPGLERGAPIFGNSVWVIAIEDGGSRVLAGTRDAGDLAVSRQGDRIAYARGTPGYDIWRIDTATGQLASLISSSSFDVNPQYSPDGDRISFASNRSGSILNYVGSAEGTNLLSLGSGCGSARWSPDGDSLVCDGGSGKGDTDIFVISASGGPRRRIVEVPASDDQRPSWSRDGEWIYFASNRTGRFQVWRVPATGEAPGNAMQVTQGGGDSPLESVDGRYVYYTKTRAASANPETAIWRVPVSGGLEEPIIESLASGDGNWDLNAEGLYYVDRQDGPKSPWVVKRYDLETTKGTRIADLSYTPSPGGPSFAVSPDGRWILSVEYSSNFDLMLIEDFE